MFQEPRDPEWPETTPSLQWHCRSCSNHFNIVNGTIMRGPNLPAQSQMYFTLMMIMNNITLAPIRVAGLKTEEAQGKARELLSRVGLQDQDARYPRQLSNGQQQRAAIARALAMNPRIMLMDQPTSALDAEMVHDVLNVMKDLTKAGITLLTITHEMGFAREVADRIILFDEGQIVDDQPPEDFCNHPRKAP